MSLRETVAAALCAANDGEDDVRAATLRLVAAAVKERDIAARSQDRCDGCGDGEILKILRQLVSQRQESARIYESAGRLDLAERERAEIDVITEFIPRPLTHAETRAAAAQIVDEIDACGLKDLGRCMGELSKRFPERVDIAQASAAVRDLLS
ncbi:MAG: GatB/YqeY domain-containing protein [Maricaulaceae bacterium]